MNRNRLTWHDAAMLWRYLLRLHAARQNETSTATCEHSSSTRHGWCIKLLGGSVAEWLACWTQAQKGLGSNRSRDAIDSSNSLRQTVHTHCAYIHQAAKLVAALLRVAGVTAGLAERNGSLPSGVWFRLCHPQADCQEPGSVPEPYVR